tara:strand:+ start:1744 stop:2433 length:690 start_codon:yes stop_codon:yes gene_type:complete
MSFEKSVDLNYQRARKALVEEISSKGISDLRVLDAFLNTPRHLFIDGAFSSRAYQDMSLPIGYHQTISQPFVVARMIELILKGNIFDKAPLGTILEIGTGCGYQTAILSNFCRKVFSIERISPLAERAKNNLKSAGVKNFLIRCADGSLGWPTFKKFDAIICSAVSSNIPEPLVKQLEVSGKLICPIGNDKDQNLILVEKKSRTEITKKVLDSVLFVPMLPGIVERDDK